MLQTRQARKGGGAAWLHVPFKEKTTISVHHADRLCALHIQTRNTSVMGL
jgi:hypothetical protein